MDRYRTYNQEDDAPVSDGDTFWLGFASRFQPTFLKPGEASFAGNMRMDRGTCQVRKGNKGLSNDISLVNPPLIVGTATLANDVPVATLTRVTTTATATTTGSHGYSTADRVNIRGALESNWNGDFTITVTGATTFTYTIAGTPATPAPGIIFANRGPRVFDDYNSSVVGSGVYASTETNTEGIVIASTSLALLYREGVSTITLSYPAGETCALGDPCDVVQFLSKVYIFRGYATAPTLAVTSITRSGTTATVTTTTNHGLVTNNWVTIAGAVPPGYNGIWQVTVTGATTFTYTVSNVLTTPATGTITARPCKPPMSWDLNTSTAAFVIVPTGVNPAGAPFIYMPAVDWGVFFKSRFVLPLSRDQLIMSDIDDATTYDPSQTQFRLLPGTNDWLIAAFPYQEARLLVLYRKSVHALLLDGTSLTIAQHFEITRNFGCVGRKTVANCGPYIVWLSDQGVVRMEIGNELSLTNASAPLSDPIQDIIDTINWAYADNAVAVYWHNRYYLAVPTNGSTVNDTVLVYNFLNDKWESVDTFPDGYDVQNFCIMSYGGTKRVHTVSALGYVFLTEELDFDEWGVPQHLEDFQIIGQLNTRNYLGGTYDLKKVRRFQLEVNVTEADEFGVQYVLSNPDATLQVINFTADETTDRSLRATVNRRGVSGRLEITTSEGRPEFKSVIIEATTTSRATISY